MKAHKYASVDSEDTSEFQLSRSRKSWLSSVAKFSILLLSFLVACGSGFFAGRWSASAATDDDSYDILQCR